MPAVAATARARDAVDSSGAATEAAGAPLSFALPEHLEAHEPPEARGLARDEVRLMVSYACDDSINHTRFTDFPELLRPGDTLLVNASATMPAALPATRPGGEPVALHLSQRLAAGRWVVELRRLVERGTQPLLDASAGELLHLPAGGTAALLSPYRPRPRRDEGTRLWLAAVRVDGEIEAYLARYGAPIRYGYVPRGWPIEHYQTIFAREPGSAEMPSAARPFTARVLRELARRGIAIAPVVLHTGVSSLEDHEPPYPERYRVDASVAALVNETRRRGGRVVAVGTTTVRAIETVAAPDGSVAAGEGWTKLVITPARRLRAVDALLTGFHEPRASHLAMLEALAGRTHLERAYAAALREGYLWHEFGDVHLILPGRARGR
ncbi:MAG TPA: S-adenosylmethionine:tRNA ribosyltransferase-isomerase [Gemmatimonadaceae bacterium]|nr:S-adenosylmethionine:tRNA ribosyltransferase-isomerase [Gemmatimonadaceae bacterium]